MASKRMSVLWVAVLTTVALLHGNSCSPTCTASSSEVASSVENPPVLLTSTDKSALVLFVGEIEFESDSTLVNSQLKLERIEATRTADGRNTTSLELFTDKANIVFNFEPHDYFSQITSIVMTTKMPINGHQTCKIVNPPLRLVAGVMRRKSSSYKCVSVTKEGNDALMATLKFPELIMEVDRDPQAEVGKFQYINSLSPDMQAEDNSRFPKIELSPVTLATSDKKSLIRFAAEFQLEGDRAGRSWQLIPEKAKSKGIDQTTGIKLFTDHAELEFSFKRVGDLYETEEIYVSTSGSRNSDYVWCSVRAPHLQFTGHYLTRQNASYLCIAYDLQGNDVIIGTLKVRELTIELDRAGRLGIYAEDGKFSH